jgi:hypothetical protein
MYVPIIWDDKIIQVVVKGGLEPKLVEKQLCFSTTRPIMLRRHSCRYHYVPVCLCQGCAYSSRFISVVLELVVK